VDSRTKSNGRPNTDSNRAAGHPRSTRPVTDASGTVVSRRDFVTFGEDIPINAEDLDPPVNL
jgi:hypothetical protein